MDKNLTTDSVTRHFFSYLAPAIGATLVTSVYILFDTIFIGQYEGDKGIFALNIVLPFYSVVFGLGLMFGIGSGIMFSYYKGKGDINKANNQISIAVVCLMSVVLLVGIIINIFFEPIMLLCGGTRSSMYLIKSYGRYVTFGMPVFALNSFVLSIIRNDNAPKLAMAAVVIGGILNIVLDYVFVFTLDMGMGGAGLATLICSFITLAIASFHFLTRGNTVKFHLVGTKLRELGKIIICGIPSFLVEIASGLMILLFNLQLMKYLGEDGVVVYGIISNAYIVAISLLNGTANACQPLMAINFGAGLNDRVNKVKKLGLISAVIISLVVLLAVEIEPIYLVHIFTSSPSDYVLANSSLALRIYFISVIFLGQNLVLMVFFQSCLRTFNSLIISLLRGAVIGSIMVFLLPFIFGAQAIWWVTVISEAITLSIGLLFNIILAKRQRQVS